VLSLLVALFLAPGGLSPARGATTSELASSMSAFCAEARLNDAPSGPVLCDPGSPPLVSSVRPPAHRRRALARLVTARAWRRPAKHRGPNESDQRSLDLQAIDGARKVVRARSSLRFTGHRTRGLAAAEPRGSISDDAGPHDPAPRFARRLELARGLVSPHLPLSFLRELA
jgi:hypothetical protein